MKFHFPSFLNNFQEMRNHAETNGFIGLCGKMFSSSLGDDFTLTIDDLTSFDAAEVLRLRSMPSHFRTGQELGNVCSLGVAASCNCLHHYFMYSVFLLRNGRPKLELSV